MTDLRDNEWIMPREDIILFDDLINAAKAAIDLMRSEGLDKSVEYINLRFAVLIIEMKMLPKDSEGDE